MIPPPSRRPRWTKDNIDVLFITSIHSHHEVEKPSRSWKRSRRPRWTKDNIDVCFIYVDACQRQPKGTQRPAQPAQTPTQPAESLVRKVSNKHLSQLLIPLVVMNDESTAITKTWVNERKLPKLDLLRASTAITKTQVNKEECYVVFM